MRLGVLDVGSNTVHLMLVDAHPGGHPTPAYKHKTELRLAELLAGGAIRAEGVKRLIAFISEALQVAEDKGAESLLAFATSALREATNVEQVLARVRAETGVDLVVLPGEDEARLTFLAVRRWFGWSAGRLLCIDIGGGSLEIANGIDETPNVAVSRPLGAGRLTRQWLPADPPSPDELRALRRHVRAQVASVVGDVVRAGSPDRCVVSSKTFKQLARACGAAPQLDGPYVARTLRAGDLAELIPRLAKASAAKRAQLPGISSGRAEQVLAGAIVADAAMDLFEVDVADVCPWALREGMILRRLDQLASG